MLSLFSVRNYTSFERVGVASLRKLVHHSRVQLYRTSKKYAIFFRFQQIYLCNLRGWIIISVLHSTDPSSVFISVIFSKEIYMSVL